MTGHRVAEIIASLRQGVTDQIDKTCKTKLPVSVESCVETRSVPVIYSEMILPLSQDGKEVNMLLWASYPISQNTVHLFS